MSKYDIEILSCVIYFRNVKNHKIDILEIQEWALMSKKFDYF